MNSDLLSRLKADYPNLRFIDGKKFAFRPPKTIVIGPAEPFAELLLLHEVSHAILKHKTFRIDLERLKMEVAAWDRAKELANIYHININEEMIQNELDTYREWLHKKSRCPRCGLTRYQTPDAKYHCPRCESLTLSH